MVKLRPQRDDRPPLTPVGGEMTGVFVRAKPGCIWTKSHSPGTFGKWLMLLLDAFVLDIPAAALSTLGNLCERERDQVCLCGCKLEGFDAFKREGVA